MKITCSICIATYKRPTLLKELLTSLVNQRLPQDITIEVIVVDNDLHKSAEGIFNSFSNYDQFVFRYYIQPIKNISLARNTAVKNATGDFIAFIDDDEIATPEWIALLLKTINDYQADGVFGRVIPKFQNQSDDWMREIFIFSKPCSPTGFEADGLRTSNCLLNASLLKERPEPFDEAYGLTGGGDTKLFKELRRKGAKFISCKEAVVYEHIPQERACKAWLCRRAFRGGNSYAREIIESSGKSKIVNRIKLSSIGIAYMLISSIAYLGTIPVRIWRTYWMLKFLANFGKIAAVFSYHFQEYK